jgi:hypothetical protein
MNKLVMIAAATIGTMIQALALAAPSVSATTQSPISVTTSAQPVALISNQGGSGQSTCWRTGAQLFYCTIDGKGYYCTTDDNPDKDVDCYEAFVVRPPRQVRPIAPVGVLRVQ